MPRSYLREARKRVGPKKERIGPIIERLAAEHADAAIALRFRSPLELLVSVMLSAQTTDVNVNRVTETLFEKYRKPEDYLAVPQEELERDIFATGFYRQKTKALRGTMRTLLEEFDGEVPRRLEELIRLPGVARKTGNVVARAACRLGTLPSPPDLARSPRLRCAPAALRGLRRQRPVPGEPCLTARAASSRWRLSMSGTVRSTPKRRCAGRPSSSGSRRARASSTWERGQGS